MSRVRAPLLFLAALVVASVAPPAAQAHPGYDPAPWETRVLHDYNDDFGGGGHVAVQDGHDVIALELAEAYDAALGADVLRFRLLLNFGYNADSVKPALRDVIGFKANGVAKTLEFRSNDNQAFTGSFDAVRGPEPAMIPDGGGNDGSRFYLTGVSKLTTLGLAKGATLTAFDVQSYAGTDRADHMPEDCGATVVPPAERSEPACYVRNQFVLQGPVQYASLHADVAKVQAVPGENRTVTLTLTSKITRPANDGRGDQVATLKATVPGGVDAVFHAEAYGAGTISFPLAKGGESVVHLYLTPGEDAASGPVTLELTTDLGGRLTKALDLVVVRPQGTTPPPGEGHTADDPPPSPDPVGDEPDPVLQDPTEETKGKSETGILPGPSAAMALVPLALAALMGRRRRT